MGLPYEQPAQPLLAVPTTHAALHSLISGGRSGRGARARAVFHLLATLVNVVEPDDISTWRTRFSNVLSASSSTRRNACRRTARVSTRARHQLRAHQALMQDRAGLLCM